MNIALLVYLVGIADNLQIALNTICIICGIVCIVCFLRLTEATTNQIASIKKIFFRFAVGFFIFIFLCAAVPSSKTLGAMVLIPAIINNEQVQDISKNTLDALQELTTQWFKALKDNSNDK